MSICLICAYKTFVVSKVQLRNIYSFLFKLYYEQSFGDNKVIHVLLKSFILTFCHLYQKYSFELFEFIYICVCFRV